MIELRNINKSYKAQNFSATKSGNDNVEVVKDFCCDISHSQLVSITGPSGCGKSTLLNIIGLLDHPDSGSITFKGKDLTKLSHKQRTKWRRDNLGFIFQFHHLIPEFTAIQNVALAGRITGVSRDQSLQKAAKLLEQLGLKDKMYSLPTTLSGGEQQRVAIARAMINNPKVILADEPTGNLDHQNSVLVFNMLKQCVSEYGITVIMVTHNSDLAAQSDTVLELCG